MSPEPQDEQDDAEIVSRLRALMAEAPFAVLCTQNGLEPYGHVVAYAYSDDLRSVALATPRDTRKVHDMAACDRVALVIDNRASHPHSPMHVAAITATGQAREIPPGLEQDLWRARLIARHPYLEDFMRETDAALFRVDLAHFLYVTQLKQVEYWTPESTGI
jgi:nitroimidazol reductase NimA-like FMN-containing flavoprotein (pyridoxamine 5'-phosphate oxidase superfamily)